jgi:hypothetical protein
MVRAEQDTQMADNFEWILIQEYNCRKKYKGRAGALILFKEEVARL